MEKISKYWWYELCNSINYLWSFNKHFTTIPDTINKNIDANYCVTETSVNNQNTLSYSLKHAFQNSFPSIKYNCTTTQEIGNIIMPLQSSNSFGYDEDFKLCFHFIRSPLDYICNRSLFIGALPDTLKYVIVSPLFKKSNKYCVYKTGQHQFFLLKNIFEKECQLDCYNVLPILIFQVKNSVFRTKLKLIMCYQLTNETLKSLNNKLLIDGFSCDLEKAFDCVNHKIILFKLVFYGMTCNHYKIYKSYMTSRYQRTLLHNEIDKFTKQT